VEQFVVGAEGSEGYIIDHWTSLPKTEMHLAYMQLLSYASVQPS